MNRRLPPPPLNYRVSHMALGPLLDRLHLSCKHHAELSLQSMDRPLRFGERTRCRIHLILCSLCRKFERQMRSLRALVRAGAAEREHTQPDPVFLNRLREEIARTPRGS